MKYFFLALVVYLTVPDLSAQDQQPPFGKADRRELEMTSCPFDPNADAVKLIDYKEKEISAQSEIRVKTIRRVKIKIFNEKGFRFANVSIPYFSRARGSKLTDIDAYIYYIDSTGKIISEKVSKKQIYREESTDKIRKLRFTFPGLRKGCVVEYQYEIKEKNTLDLEPWLFQDLIPTQWSAFRLVMPTVVKLEVRFVGNDSPKENQRRQKKSSFSNFEYFEREYMSTNIPAFRPEPMMSSVADNLQRVEFALQPMDMGLLSGNSNEQQRWNFLAAILNASPEYGVWYTAPITGTDSLLSQAKKLVSREEQIDFIFQSVKKKVNWDGDQSMYVGDLNEVWQEGSGNSAELNMIVLNLLKKTGIPSSPILVSTRNHGRPDPNFITLSQFDGLDVMIRDRSGNYILDATRRHQSYQTPPDNILNRDVLSIDTAAIGWLHIGDGRPLLNTNLHVYSMLTPEGKVKGTASITYSDHSKVQRLKEDQMSVQEKEEEEKEFVQKDFSELTIDSLSRQNAEDELKPLEEFFTFTYAPPATDSFVFIDPMFLSNFRKNPFTDSLRRTDLDFGSRQHLASVVSITLPDNIDVDHLPKNTLLRMADSAIFFERKIFYEKKQLVYMTTMDIQSPLFDKADYEAVRQYFERLYAMINEQVILKKKK